MIAYGVKMKMSVLDPSGQRSRSNILIQRGAVAGSESNQTKNILLNLFCPLNSK